jgi:asparagine synthase (glutamine-hydrolysing)
MMSAICAILTRNGKRVTQATIGAMTAALDYWQSDRTGTWCSSAGTAALGHVLLINTSQSSAEYLPNHEPTSGLAITADARLDNRQELFSQLKLPDGRLSDVPDSHLILAAYRQWGCDCAAHMVGDFTFVIWDESEQRLYCARDHLGVRPLYYYYSSEIFLLATEMKGLFAAGAQRDLNREWVADALIGLIADKESTPYQNVWRLPPANWFSVSTDGIQKTNYWRLDPKMEICLPSEADYVEGLCERLAEAVSCRMHSLYPVGAELSGGLDSSSVAGIAASLTEAQDLTLTTFSHVLADADRSLDDSIQDERAFQELLINHAGISQAVSVSGEERGVIDALKRSLQVQDGLTGWVYGGLNDVLFEAVAGYRIRTLLSGFGGDDLVSIQATEYRDELARGRAWLELWQDYRHVQRLPIKRILSKMLGVYLPSLESLYVRMASQRWAAEDADPRSHLSAYPITPAFYQSVGIGDRLAQFPRTPADMNVREAQFQRIMHPHIPLRLEYCAVEAAAQRIEYRYPLLDIRLIEFHLAAPAHLKRKAGVGRYLFRKAIQGFVPREIQWREDKAVAPVPGAVLRLVRDQVAIEELITRSRLGQAAEYVNLDQVLHLYRRIVHQRPRSGPIRLGILVNALKLLLFFDEGSSR